MQKVAVATDRDSSFINPYTFVPLQKVKRTAPAGHDRLGDRRYCGRISVTLTARSRVLVRGVDDEDTGQPLLPWRPGPGGSRQAIVPGSSIAGAVRSLHEALAGGCLRVFDGDFVPTYRDLASPNVMQGLKLGLVKSSDDNGTPTEMWVCTDVVWVDVEALCGVLHQTPVSGMVLDIDAHAMAKRTDFGRMLADVSKASIAPGQSPGNWVVLVGDAGARENVHVFRVALGKLSHSEPVAFPDDGAHWASYKRRAMDSSDMVHSGARDAASLKKLLDQERSGGKPPTVEVVWNGGVIGRRQRVRPWLLPLTVVWLRLRGSDRRIIDVKRAVLWRHDGRFAASTRVGDAIACNNVDELCPSCRMFGSADVEGRQPDDPALQKSYAGHVRFTDLIAEGLAPDDGEVEELAPLSSPRPGSGEFYLENDKLLPAKGDESDVVREWGSSAGDGPNGESPRRIRGRKFYWRTTDAQGDKTERWQRRPNHTNEDIVVRARLFPVGQAFTTTVWFDGLSETELGGLLSAIAPQLLLGSDGKAVCLPLGGGKPFGFGALEVAVSLDEIDSAASRYADGPRPSVTVESAVEAFRTEYSSPSEWKALAAALALDHIDPAQVWYPPGATWDAHSKGTASALRKFDEGYEFWKRIRGQRLRNEDRPLIPLPRATEREQGLEI
jgi:hypothetical protein